MKALVDVFMDVKNSSEHEITQRFSVSKTNVLKIMRQLVKEQFNEEDELKEKQQKPKPSIPAKKLAHTTTDNN